jgi:hypothetical protein
MNAMRMATLVTALAFCSTAIAQDAPQPPPAEEPAEGERGRRVHSSDELELPLPIGSPRVLQPGTLEPLTAEQKAARALRNTIGLKPVANRALLAGINQWMDHPEEWGQGWDAYGKRFASRYMRLAVRNAVQLGADVAFKTDPRYDLCNCSGFLARTGHAWKRVLVARKDSGGETIAISRLAGAYVTPMITDQWYPERLNTWGHKLDSGSQFLMWRGVTNMIREFWPEISRKVPLAKRVYNREP